MRCGIPVPWLAVALVPLFSVLLLGVLPDALRDVRAEETFLDKKARSGLSSIALGLARKGHAQSFRDLVELLRDLRAPSKEVDVLVEKGERQLTRTKKVRDAKYEQKKLRKITDELAARLADMAPEARTYLAQVIVHLDADQPAARKTLEHVRHAGAWVPRVLVPQLELRALIEDLVQHQRKAKFEIELGISDEPSFVKAYGDQGAVARHKSVEVHVARTGAAGARRMLLQALRGWSLAAELAGLPPDLLPELPIRIAFHGTHAEYLRSIAQAVAAKRLPASAAKIAAEHRTYRTSDHFLVASSGIEAHHMTFVLFDIWFGHARRRWDDTEPLPCLEAGFLNWVMLQIMGCPLPRIRWLETEYERALGATLSDKDNVTRKHLFKLANAGLAGTRAYMRFLMERRIDPPWKNAFHTELGQVRGHELLKCTIVAEYLLEADLLRRVFKQTLEADPASQEATAAALEQAVGRPLATFEADLRTWMIHHAEPGLLQRLQAPVQAAGASASNEPVPYLTALRKRAFRRSNAISLEPGLSAGATAHARYLARYPKQAEAWPDAHEEYVDHEGYSPAGARAGASSVIAPGSATWKQAVDAWMGTYFHRLPLLDPGLLGVGAGLEDGFAVLDTASLVAEWESSARIGWPPHGAKQVPLRFVSELPTPVPGVSQATMGYPITLQIYKDPGQLTMVMKLLAPDGSDVPCHFTAPHAPLNPELVPPGAYCLIPMAPLQPATTYTVRITGIASESETGPTSRELSWSFTTRK